MPFSPLPEFLLHRFRECPAAEEAVVYDLGCGDGALGGILAGHGLEVLGVDLIRPDLGSAAKVVGDALLPPFGKGLAHMVVAGNLFRHLLVQDPRAGFLKTWSELLKKDGSLIIMEDEPDRNSPNSRNFADLQDFLVTLTEGRRGGLLNLAGFRDIASGMEMGGSWATGRENNTWPLDPTAVVNFLRGEGAPPQGQAARLIEAIDRDGLSCGKFWWACWRKG